MALVELGRAVQRHHRPDRLAGPAQPGPAEPRVHLLQVVGGRRDPPEHVVRVRPQALQVVAAAGDDALARRLLAQLADLGGQAARPGGSGLPGRVEGAGPGHPEDRPHGVADQLVEVPCLGPRPVCLLSPCRYCPTATASATPGRRAPGRRPAAPRRCRPGSRSRRRRRRIPPARAARPPRPGCGRPAPGGPPCTAAGPPPHRSPGHAAGAPRTPVAAARSAAARPVSSRVIALQQRLLAHPATEQRTISRPALRRCGHLTVLKVTALTACPSTAGTR